MKYVSVYFTFVKTLLTVGIIVVVITHAHSTKSLFLYLNSI